MKTVLALVIVLFVAVSACAPAPVEEPDDEVEEEEKEVDEDETREITLYFGCPEAAHTGEPGEYGYVTPVTREIPHTDEVLRAAVRELLDGPKEEEEAWCDECAEDEWEPCDECLEHRVTAVAPSSADILGVDIEDGVATVDLCEELFAADEGVAGTLGGSVFMESVIWTATEFPAVDEVQVLVEGEYYDDGHRLWDEPAARPTDEARQENEVEEWVERSRDLPLAQAREIDGALYLLVTYGERPSGGYSVEIVEVTDDHPDFDAELVVTAEFTEPDEDEPVTDAITRPYALQEVDPADMPVQFLAEGDREFVPSLHDLDYLPPLVAGDEDIRLIAPEPGDAVDTDFVVEGIENVFEGTVLYRLLDAEGEELDSGLASGHGHDWGHFQLEPEVPDEVTSGDEIRLEVYSESPKDGSVENLVQLDLTLR